MEALTTSKARKPRLITSGRVDRNKPASIVIDKFGGLTPFCNETGYKTSTAHAWTLKGYIPPLHKGEPVHPHIISVGARIGVTIDPSDFVDRC